MPRIAPSPPCDLCGNRHPDRPCGDVGSYTQLLFEQLARQLVVEARASARAIDLLMELADIARIPTRIVRQGVEKGRAELSGQAS